MRAAIATGGGARIEIGEVELAAPGPRDVIVRIEASAVCRTDQLINDGPASPQRPWIPGHSASGIVIDVGDRVTKARPGDRVVVTGTMECHTCYSCRRGSPSQCERLWAEVSDPPVVGRTADGRAVVGAGGAGTFAEYMNYREHCFAVVDSGLDPIQLALLGCGGISGVGAVWEVAAIAPGDQVVILGLGHLGLWMAQAARAVGAGEIIGVDPIADRRELAVRLGATATCAPDDAAALVAERTRGRGADTALEATGEPGGVEIAFSLARNGGTVVATSMVAPIDTAITTLPTNAMTLLGKTIRGSQSGGGFIDRDIQRIADAIEAGQLDVDTMISQVFTLDEAAEALAAAVDRRLVTGVIDLRPGVVEGAGPFDSLRSLRER